MTQEIFDDDELEDQADKARDNEVAKVWADTLERYKTFYGEYPEEKLSISEIQERIRVKMPRPFKI